MFVFANITFHKCLNDWHDEIIFSFYIFSSDAHQGTVLILTLEHQLIYFSTYMYIIQTIILLS